MKKYIIPVLVLAVLLSGCQHSILRQASMESNNFAEFDGTSVASGALVTINGPSYDGTYFARARYTGAGVNGYARGQWNVTWPTGSDVWYSGAFYLPAGFKASQQGQVSLMRWDNWSLDPTTTDQGGVVLHSDGSLVVVRQKLGSVYVELSEHMTIHEGEWTWLEVHQRLSEDPSVALTEFWVKGIPSTPSNLPNSSGRDVTRLRYGIVSVSAGQQINNLELWFDRAFLTNGYDGGTV